MRSPAKLGSENFRALLRQGKEQMPAFSEQVLPAESVDALEAYLVTLPARRCRAGGTRTRSCGCRRTRTVTWDRRFATPDRFPPAGTPATGCRQSDRRGRSSSPTTSTRARSSGASPTGMRRAWPRKGIMSTGTVRPRNGPVVTAGGLVFVAN